MKLEDRHKMPPAPCLLCEIITSSFGVFVPLENLEFGINENQGIAYPLCEDCQKSNQFQEIENKLKKFKFPKSH